MTPLRGVVRRAIFGSSEKWDGDVVPTRTSVPGNFASEGLMFDSSGAKTKMSDSGTDGMTIWRPDAGKPISAYQAMSQNTGWVYAAVNAIANEIANTQWRLYQVTGKDHEEVDEHELLDLLEGVNEFQTGPELKHQIASHLEFTGNAYLYLLGAKRFEDKPKAVYLLNPGRTRVKLDKTTFPWKVSHYEMTLETKTYTFQPYEVVHIKYPDPNDQHTGIGFVQAIPVWIDVDNYAMEYNRKFFINGAKLDVVLETDAVSEAQAARLGQQLKNKTEGIKNAHKMVTLPKGAKVQQIGTSQKDMDFAVLAENARDRILAAARVSKTILGTAESDTNRATAETADYVFAKRTIKPKMMLICAALNEFLVPRYADDIYITFVDPVPEDKNFRTLEMQASVASMPVMTQNEARKNYLGLGPVEGGDSLVRPGTMVEAGTNVDGDGGDDVKPENSGKSTEERAKMVEKQKRLAQRGYIPPVFKNGDNKYKTQFSRNKKMRAEITEALGKRIEEALKNHKHVTKMTDEEYQQFYKRFISNLDIAEEKLVQKLQRMNDAQKTEVMSNLAKATGVTKGVGNLFNLDNWIGITVDLATPIMTELANTEAHAASAMIEQPAANILADEATKTALDSSIRLMATSYNETALTTLKGTLSQGISDGLSYDALAQKVSDIYDFQNTVAAARIARTETVRVANMANKAAWQQSGVVKTVIWYVFDDSACTYCLAQKGVEIDISQDFFAQGADITGTDGNVIQADYSAIGGPPLHPNCRCYLRPGQVSLD